MTDWSILRLYNNPTTRHEKQKLPTVFVRSSKLKSFRKKNVSSRELRKIFQLVLSSRYHIYNILISVLIKFETGLFAYILLLLFFTPACLPNKPIPNKNAENQSQKKSQHKKPFQQRPQNPTDIACPISDIFFDCFILIHLYIPQSSKLT
jgi:hypothetical protein